MECSSLVVCPTCVRRWILPPMKANEVCAQPSWTPRFHQTQTWKIDVFMNLVHGTAPVKMVFGDFAQPAPSIPALETEVACTKDRHTDPLPGQSRPTPHTNLQHPPEGSYSRFLVVGAQDRDFTVHQLQLGEKDEAYSWLNSRHGPFPRLLPGPTPSPAQGSGSRDESFVHDTVLGQAGQRTSPGSRLTASFTWLARLMNSVEVEFSYASRKFSFVILRWPLKTFWILTFRSARGKE